MKKIKLEQTISILANIGVIAGIVFLAFELRQNTVSTQLAAASSYQPTISQMLLLLLEDDELAETVRRGSAGNDLTEFEQFQLGIFYMSVLRSWQNPHYQYRVGAMDSELWTALRLSLRQTLRRNRGLRDYWDNADRGEFPQDFIAFMDELMSEVAEE